MNVCVPHWPEVSIIVPSLDDSRKHHLDALLKDLEKQTFQAYHLHVIRGDRRQGRAINQGIREAQEDIVIILDDDTRLANDRVLENVLSCLLSDPGIGMAGASTLIPEWANGLQRRAMRELPRRTFPLVEVPTESDMVQHPCCAMRKSLFLEIGGEREDIVRGLDPDLRQRVRDRGYRVVIAPQCGVYHLLPSRFFGLMAMAFRNGKGSAFAQRTHPELIVETGDGFDEGFARRVPFGERILRYPARILQALIEGKPILFCWLLVYALGHAMGYVWLWRFMQEEVSCEDPARDQ